MFKNLKLRTKLMVTGCFLTVLPLLIVTAVNYSSNRTMEDRWLSAGNQVSIFHHLPVNKLRARVLDILDNRFPPRNLSASDDISGDQYLRPMAYGKHRLAASNKPSRERHSVVIRPQLVRRVASRYEESIKITHAGVLDCRSNPDRSPLFLAFNRAVLFETHISIYYSRIQHNVTADVI